MEFTQKPKFKGRSHFRKPQHYCHRKRHPQNRGNGYLDMLIGSLWPKNRSKSAKK